MNIWELQESKNIEPELTKEQSEEIGRDVVADWKIDEESRSEWKERSDNAIKLAVQMVEKKNTPWPNSSNVKFPLVTIAALQFSARAYPALVKGSNIVKYRVNGKDEGGAKAARASRISQHMSYQLLEQDEMWEEDQDRAFIALPIIGTIFKKSFFDPIKGHNVSKLVLPQNLAVSYYTKTIEGCERKTETFELYEREVKARVLKEVFSKKDLGKVTVKEDKLSDDLQGITPPPPDKKRSRPFLEQHIYLDLDDDGYEEPYVVTVDESSQKVVRIVARFGKVETEQSVKIKALGDQGKMLELQIKEIVSQVPQPQGQEDERALMAAQKAEQMVLQIRQKQQELQEQIKELEASNKKKPKVLEVVAEEHYTKYGLIPSPDGGFYDLGLGSLLGPLNDSVNTLINQLIDLGTLNNGSHGFIGRGARIQGGRIEFDSPFEWKRVNTTGQSLRDSLVPLPVNQPSAVLFSLLSLLITYSEQVSSVTPAMTGANPGQNTPAYTQQSMLEQGLSVFNGIFKRIYRSYRKELRKLYVLNSIYLNPIEYFETVDGDASIARSDYAGDPKDCKPAADPNAMSNMENMQKAVWLSERAKVVPGYDIPKIELLNLQAMEIADVSEIYPTDEKGKPLIPPPKNPELEIETADLQRKTIESQARQQTNHALAESKMDVDESVVLLNSFKAGAIDQKTVIDEFNAITKRMEARSKDRDGQAKANGATAS